MNRKLIFRVLFILWTATIITLTSIPKMQSPVGDIIGSDKVAHFTVYLIFAWLFLKMHGKDVNRRILNRLILLAVGIPILDELHQIPIPGRQFSVWDMLADFIGFSIIILIYNRKLKAINRL